jgi:hypothetical protein
MFVVGTGRRTQRTETDMNEIDEDEVDENEVDETEVGGLDEARVCELLTAGLEEIAESEDLGRVRVSTFEDVGLLTRNKGIVVRIGDAEFQVTVVRSR